MLQVHGADSQIRTGDLILTKDALYRLSYISMLPFDNKGNISTTAMKMQELFSRNLTAGGKDAPDRDERGKTEGET